MQEVGSLRNFFGVFGEKFFFDEVVCLFFEVVNDFCLVFSDFLAFQDVLCCFRLGAVRAFMCDGGDVFM